jgi:hypothetical protein
MREAWVSALLSASLGGSQSTKLVSENGDKSKLVINQKSTENLQWFHSQNEFFLEGISTDMLCVELKHLNSMGLTYVGGFCVSYMQFEE